MIVAEIVTINVRMSDAGDNIRIITKVVIRKASVPSSDLLNNNVEPYLMPMIAAAESDKLMTKMATIAIFSSKR